MDSIIPIGQKNALAEYMILSGADNRPPMLDKDLYDSWKSRMELYMQNREHERILLKSIENGPLIWPTVKENGVIRTKKYTKLSDAEKIQADCNMKATNIILQGKRVFLNSLPPEWSKFVTEVKLVKDLHTTNFDQLHAYLEQHELHANEVRLLRERNQDPLAFVVNQQMTPPYFNTCQSSYNNPQLQQQFSSSQYGSIHPNQHYSSTYPSQPQFNHSSVPPSYPYQSQMNHQTSSAPQIAYQSPQVSTQPMTESPLVDSSFAIPVFSPRDDPIACLNKAMAFLTVVASSRFLSTNNQLRTSSNPRNQATIQDGRVTVQQVQGRQGLGYSSTGYKSNDTSSRGNNASGQTKVVKCYNCQDPGVPDSQAVQTIIPNNAAFQTEDLDTYDSDCDDISNAKSVLMANISNYVSDVVSEVPHSETYLNDMENQSVHAMQDFEQTPTVDVIDNEITSDSNIIPYFQYLQETQQANEKANKEHNNESIIVELERYKERVKTIEQCLNIELSSREKMIDSQMDDMIKEKLALKEQVDSLKQNLSKQIKEKECLLQTFTVFKNESKEKENKYMENEIDLEKKIKELDNIIFKVGQSAQTVNMLTKPQIFYDNIHKQALGYQNPFYLKKGQRIKATLYDGIVISAKHVAMPVIDDEETLILEDESRSKMSKKEKDPEAIKQNISYKPIDYELINRLSDDFGKRFTLQQELSAEQAFWLRMSNPSSKPSDASPVKIEAPKELPKVSLVNESLKKIKFHLTRFDNMVKIRTTPDARTEGEWMFEHTKAVFNNEIIPFLKSLKDIFNVFDRDLLNEIMEVQTVFDQMDAVFQQSSVDKQCLEIAKKELLLENDRLLEQIMSQDVLLTVMNSMSLFGESVNMDRKRNESCDKYFNLEAKLLKLQNAHNDLLKSYSQLEKHCISLELFFENNDLNAQLLDKDSIICKLKDIIKSMREKSKEENVNYDYGELETKNVKLENSVAKLILENERLCNEINHVKQVFKEKFDSIKKIRVCTKEHSDSLINKLNLKSAENEDLKAQIQDKIFVITSLKKNLQKIKGKDIVGSAAQIPSAHTIVPGMFKIDLEPLAPRLLQNKEAHIDYLKYTQEQADILRGIVKQAKAKQPSDDVLDFACKHACR
ncbi:hypothetical protein Tco_1254008 [Tanacetum coccineum]